MKIFIDTGGFAALYNRKDGFHDQAKSIWANLTEKRPLLFTSNFVVSETITLLRKRGDLEASIQFGDALFSSGLVRIVRVNESQETQAWVIYKKFRDQDFSFTDCASFAVMQELGISKAFAFDHHFSVIGFERLD